MTALRDALALASALVAAATALYVMRREPEYVCPRWCEEDDGWESCA